MQGPEKNRRTRTEKNKNNAGNDLMESNGTLAELRQSNALYTVSRLEYIRLRLQRGDKKQIAEKLGIHPEWVSQVIRGKGASEPVLQEAERIIKGRCK